MEFTQSIVTEKQHEFLVKYKNLDFAFSFSGRRFRVNVSFQMSNYMIVIRLLKATDGSGVKMVKEILVKNPAISNLIRENDLHQIPSIMQMGSRDGMQILEKDIIDLINMGNITEEEGLKYANNPKVVKEGLN